MSYNQLCDECRYEDLAVEMLEEMEEWRSTGELPDPSPKNPYGLPKPNRDGPPTDRWPDPGPVVESD
jgi:hypothetical protein